jgi:hypothetical protein
MTPIKYDSTRPPRPSAILALGTGLLLGVFATAAFAQPGPGEKDKPEFPKFEDVTKDMKVREGFLTLYHDEKTDRLLAKIPSSLLKKNLFWASSIAQGRDYAGFQWNDGAVYFERIGKHVVMMEADSRYTKGKGTPIGDAIARTYTDSIIRSIPIATLSGSDPVIDLADLLKSDLVDIGSLYGGKVDRGLSRFGLIRTFKENTEIAVDLAVMGQGGGEYVTVHYSVSALPEGGSYTPREADPRVGYFLTAQKDWTSDRDAGTVFKRYVNRWHLRKAQPDEAVSDVLPEDQIIFYIEKTVPVQYRSYVREGILEWNKAYEAAGLRNAIVVEQQTDNLHNEKDPEDVQYNFFRWIVSGRPFAMGPSRVNPFTGQILDADIIFDDSYIRYWTMTYDLHGPQPTASLSDAPMREFFAVHGDGHGAGNGSSGWGDAPANGSLALMENFEEHRAGTWGTTKEHHLCEMGMGATRQLTMASMMFAANGKRDLPEEFIGQAIKETVMHEVGHVLGLRHNFKGSSWRRLAEMKNSTADPNHQLTGSVMDYNPYIYDESEAGQGYFATPTLGPYDYWAIEYGYRVFAASKEEGAPKDEKEMLKRIASRCAEPGLDFATDEDTSFFYPDPLVNRWDNGKDPLEFAQYMTSTAERLWAGGMQNFLEDGDSLSRMRQAFGMVLGEYGFGGVVAARQIGGQYIHRDHKADPNARPPIEIVPAPVQRAALKFVGDKILSANSLSFPPDLLNSLAAGRWGHWDSDSYDASLTYDIHDAVLNMQARVVFQILNPFTLNRVYDAEVKVNGEVEPVTVVEVLGTLSGAIWSELSGPRPGPYSARTPMISSYRRNLQRDHLQRLIDMVTSRPGTMVNADVHAVARMTLKKLGASIDQVMAPGANLDEYTRAHLTDSRERITRALDAEYVVAESQRGGGGGRVIIIGAEAGAEAPTSR